MTIETNLQRIADALESIAAHLTATPSAAAPAATAPAPESTPATATDAVYAYTTPAAIANVVPMQAPPVVTREAANAALQAAYDVLGDATPIQTMMVQKFGSPSLREIPEDRLADIIEAAAQLTQQASK